MEENVCEFRQRIARWDEERVSKSMASVMAMQILARSKSPPLSACSGSFAGAGDSPVSLVQLEAELAAAEELLAAARHPSVRASLEQLAQQIAAVASSGTPLSLSYSTGVDELTTRFALAHAHYLMPFAHFLFPLHGASRILPLNASL